ncbi:signal peptide peptidase-domain-containing protein [Phyllosticta citribraziliensis]|uniref:Signal peptide peptidase-domain-containing protein n=1 Tax=Phyllosticta citribraziliensis TaxID=989973 RepID=A0ABR1LQV1_9PEZI
MDDPGPFYELLGKLAYAFTEIQPLIPTYAHLIVSALFPIYAGAHASLSRPTSAAKPHKPKKKVTIAVEQEEEDSEQEEEDEIQKMEGLSPGDALIFPLMAGVTLTGLYFLIKWLKDPAILNKVLNGYFALFGLLSVSRFLTDGMDLIHGIVFPRSYSIGKTVYDVHTRAKVAKPLGSPRAKAISSPLPGIFGQIPLPSSVEAALWKIRNTPKVKLTAKLFVRNIVSAKARIGIFGVAGFVLGLAAVLYFNLVDKPWFLTNLMGFAFSYGALQIMSPTTFSTGTLLLSALFFYDIYMVFFTPMMVTVAKSLDIPIKLLFPRPDVPSKDPNKPPIKQHAMLGLGDVVLPGIMIGLALRFDLYMFYLRRQFRTGVAPVSDSPTSTTADGAENSDKATETEQAQRSVVHKVPYTSVSGRWGEYLWSATPYHDFTFPTPYFKATMAGYVVGMLATLAAMQIANHPQPALLYLVPGVLISAWATALFRGELKEMWEFSEAVDDEEEETHNDTAKKIGSQSILSKERAQRFEKRVKNAMEKNTEGDSTADDKGISQPKRDRKSEKEVRDRELLHFSVVAPYSPKKSKRGNQGSNSGADSTDSDEAGKDMKSWSTRIEVDAVDGSPAKRRRVS